MLINLFNDIRLVGIVGCITASLGFACSYFVTDISLLTLTYGAVGGRLMRLISVSEPLLIEFETQR